MASRSEATPVDRPSRSHATSAAVSLLSGIPRAALSAAEPGGPAPSPHAVPGPVMGSTQCRARHGPHAVPGRPRARTQCRARAWPARSARPGPSPHTVPGPARARTQCRAEPGPQPARSARPGAMAPGPGVVRGVGRCSLEGSQGGNGRSGKVWQSGQCLDHGFKFLSCGGAFGEFREAGSSVLVLRQQAAKLFQDCGYTLVTRLLSWMMSAPAGQ